MGHYSFELRGRYISDRAVISSLRMIGPIDGRRT